MHIFLSYLFKKEYIQSFNAALLLKTHNGKYIRSSLFTVCPDLKSNILTFANDKFASFTLYDLFIDADQNYRDAINKHLHKGLYGEQTATTLYTRCSYVLQQKNKRIECSNSSCHLEFKFAKGFKTFSEVIEDYEKHKVYGVLSATV